ncbi:MAG TPA: hypothetical protein VFA49_01440, partial [Chloroflexota bacterium]|nr:hypothetical protein [Chloroflexota bacterium]
RTAVGQALIIRATLEGAAMIDATKGGSSMWMDELKCAGARVVGEADATALEGACRDAAEQGRF